MLDIYPAGQAMVRDLDSLNGVFVKMTGEEELTCRARSCASGQELLRFELIAAPEPTPDGTELMGSPNPGYWGKPDGAASVATTSTGPAFPLHRRELSRMGRERGEINFPDDGYVSGLHARVTAPRRSRVPRRPRLELQRHVHQGQHASAPVGSRVVRPARPAAVPPELHVSRRSSRRLEPRLRNDESRERSRLSPFRVENGLRLLFYPMPYRDPRRPDRWSSLSTNLNALLDRQLSRPARRWNEHVDHLVGLATTAPAPISSESLSKPHDRALPPIRSRPSRCAAPSLMKRLPFTTTYVPPSVSPLSGDERW
jgi:hypothetical protein